LLDAPVGKPLRMSLLLVAESALPFLGVP
jgi:hypothetical protein